MAVLRSLLAFFGALDQAVKDRPDVPEVAATVDRYLPDAASHQGWFAEIEEFLFGVRPEEARQRPDLGAALADIINNASRLTNLEKSRLVYGIGAITHLESSVDSVRQLVKGRPNPFAEVLALAGPGHTTGSKSIQAHRGNQLWELLRKEFNSSSDWDRVTQLAVEQKCLDPLVKKAPLCHGAVVTVDGVPCVVVDTEYSDEEACLNNVKAAAEPKNWHDNYPAFFCAMAPKPDRKDSWSRILETVGVCGIQWSRRLHTDLKYYKSEQGQNAARLDYDLHKPSPDDPLPVTGDGQVTVDRGFINMRAPYGDPARPPVWVKTRKVCRIKGLSPYAQAQYVCILGYGNAFHEFMFGSTGKPKFPWTPSPPPPAARTTHAAPTAAAPPSNGDAISSAITVLAENVQSLTEKSFNLSGKWFSGQLSVKDLADFSADVGAEWAATPWRFLQELSRPGSVSQPTNTSEGGPR